MMGTTTIFFVEEVLAMVFTLDNKLMWNKLVAERFVIVPGEPWCQYFCQGCGKSFYERDVVGFHITTGLPLAYLGYCFPCCPRELKQWP